MWNYLKIYGKIKFVGKKYNFINNIFMKYIITNGENYEYSRNVEGFRNRTY